MIAIDTRYLSFAPDLKSLTINIGYGRSVTVDSHAKIRSRYPGGWQSYSVYTGDKWVSLSGSIMRQLGKYLKLLNGDLDYDYYVVNFQALIGKRQSTK